jgi:hypothetical protein
MKCFAAMVSRMRGGHREGEGWFDRGNFRIAAAAEEQRALR